MGIPERKEREKELRREAIIQAAQEVFFEKGLGLATMDEIAERAELSKGTLYLYYKSKEDLYITVSMRGVETLAMMFERVVETGQPTLKLVFALGDAYLDFFKQHRQYFRMFAFMQASSLHTQVSQEVLQSCAVHNDRVWKVVVDVIQRAIDEGIFKSDINPWQAAIILWSNGNGLMREMDRAGDHWSMHMNLDLEETARKAYQYLIEGMLNDEREAELVKEFFPPPAAIISSSSS